MACVEAALGNKHPALLQVKDGTVKEFPPYKPSFRMSPPFKVQIDLATHTAVYGPHTSLNALEDEDFPYNSGDGVKFAYQLYHWNLTYHSRVMNPLKDPESKHEVYGSEQSQYFEANKSNQAAAAALSRQLLLTMCGKGKQADVPAFQRLVKMLDDMQASCLRNLFCCFNDATKFAQLYHHGFVV